jgi:hypothetical protein
MALAKELMGAGFSAGQAIASGGAYAAVVAAGSAQGDATLIGASMNMVTGADGSKGVRLPAAQVGDELWVFNNAGSTLKVYPPSGAAISVGGTGVGSGDAAFSQLTYKASLYKCLTATQWLVITSV